MASDLRILVVDDDDHVRSALADVLASRASELVTAATAAAARAAIAERAFDVVLLDVALPDGTAFDVLDALSESGAAVIAVSGAATPDDGFRLAERGVRAFLPKPLRLSAVEGTLDAVLAAGPDLAPHVRQRVGHGSLHEIEEDVRATLVDQALAKAGGSRRGAAKLLGTSRQVLQQYLAKRR